MVNANDKAGVIMNSVNGQLFSRVDGPGHFAFCSRSQDRSVERNFKSGGPCIDLALRRAEAPQFESFRPRRFAIANTSWPSTGTKNCWSTSISSFRP
jgi:hypothetical protein